MSRQSCCPTTSYNVYVFFSPLFYSKECLVSSSGNDNTENGLPGTKADSKPTPKAWKQHVCVHMWAYVYMHNYNRLKESHNYGQFYSLYLMRNMLYKYVIIYFRLCLRKNMKCCRLDHWTEKHNCTTNRKHMMADALVCLHSALSGLWDTALTLPSQTAIMLDSTKTKT